jgi:hypothetical protein
LIDECDHHASLKKEADLLSRSASVKKLLLGNDIYNSAASLCTELNGTGSKSEQSVILTATNVNTRVKVGAALSDKDLTSVYSLTIVALHA